MLTWEGSDVVFEEALSFSSLGHEARECSLHVSPLCCCLFSHHLVVRHRLSERLRGKQQLTQFTFRILSVTHDEELGWL